MKYKAFLSYSHAADNDLAADIQSALHKFAKNWMHFRAIRTFRDTTNLPVTPALWHSITAALDETEFFILMASPEAARSSWVDKEVDYWLNSRSLENAAENFLIVLTNGQLVWNNDQANPDFDWERTNALPPSLKGVFPQEPRYADLSWATKREDRSLRSPRFRGAIADLAAPLHGKDKDDLDGEDIRQYKKATHFRQLVFAIMIVLLLISLTAAAFAWRQNGIVQQNAKDARENQLKAEENALLARQKQKEAEDNLREANRQTQIADKERVNAQNQTDIANQQRKVAERQQQIATSNARLAERKNYLANVAYIMSADETTRVSEYNGIKDRLDSMDEPLRSWEWGYLRLRRDNSLLTIDGQRVFSEVADVSISRDGSRIVSATDDNTIRVWNGRTGENLLTFPASDALKQKGMVKKVGFSSDGSRIVSGAEDGTVRVWDAVSGAKLLDLGHKHRDPSRRREVQATAFSRDGTKILSLTYEEFRVWDAKTGESLNSVDFAPEGKVFAVAFSPDGSSLVEHDGIKSQTRIRDVETGQFSAILQGEFVPYVAVGFSPDGRQFAASDRNELINVWDVKSGNLNFTLSGHKTRVEDLVFSLNGKRLASCSYEGIRVWNLDRGNQITLLQGHRSTVSAVAFGADDNFIVSGAEDSTLRTWDVSTAAHISLPQAHVIRGLAVSRDGKYVAAGERSFGQEDQPRVLIYEASTLNVTRVLSPLIDDIIRMDFSADGRQLAVAGANGIARIFDCESGKLRGTIKGNHPVNSVAFSSNGQYLATGTRDGYVTVWMAQTMEPVWSVKGHEDIVDQLNFSPDSARLVSGSWDKSIKIWKARTGLKLNTLEGHDGAVFSVNFGPDASRICSASLDKTIKLWEPLNGNPPNTLDGHTSGVTSAVFSLDGRRIFSASSDTSLRLWDAEAKEFIAVLREASPLRDWNMEAGAFNLGIRNANLGIQDLVLSADGKRLVAALTETAQKGGGAKSYLMIWNTSLPPNRSSVHAQTLAIEPRVSATPLEPATTSVNDNVVSVHPQSLFDIEQWFDRRTTRAISVLGFIRAIRYGGSSGESSNHDLRYEKALVLEDGSAKSYVRRGQAYFDRGDNRLAIYDFTEAIRLEPDNARTFGLRGMTYYFDRRLPEALSDISKAISLCGERIPPAYLLLRGNIYTQLNDFMSAVTDLDRAVTLMSGESLPLIERGKLFLKMGDYDRAATDFSRAIKIEPRNPLFYDYRGSALHQKYDLAGAEKDFKEAIKIDPGFLDSYYHLAALLFDGGRYDESLSQWEIFLKLAPEGTKATALAGKAITLAALGKEDLAFSTYMDAAMKNIGFWRCTEGFKDDYFWAKSGCRAASPLVEKIRASIIKTGMERLRQSPTK